MKRTNHNEENNQVVYPTPVLANMRGSRGVTFMEKKNFLAILGTKEIFFGECTPKNHNPLINTLL